MKPKYFLAIAGIALIVALPVSKVIAEQKAKLLEQQQKIEQIEKKNKDLDKKLQTKLSLKARIASAVVAEAAPQPAPQPPAAAAPIAPPAPQPVPAPANCEAYRGLISQYAWPVPTMMAVMQAESGCNPGSLSPTCDRGLLQVNCVHVGKVGGNLAALFDPATNIRVAYQIYSTQGIGAWSAYKNGAYLKFLR